MVSTIRCRTFVACADVKEPVPTGRPRGLALSARNPPCLVAAIHWLAARTLTPNSLAAAVWVSPPRTACTTVRRTCACVAASNRRPSARFTILVVWDYALGDTRVSKLHRSPLALENLHEVPSPHAGSREVSSRSV